MFYIKKIFNEFNIIIILVCIWAYYFLYSTIIIEDGPESVLLIKPLFFLLIIFSIFTILQTFIKNLRISSELFEKKKIYFLVSVLIYFITLKYFGYLLPTFFFYLVLSYLLGSKSKLTILPSIFSLIIIYFFFSKLLKIPLPLW